MIDTECDLYSPCAVGGTLNAETIPRLRCRAVAGCANNQLAEPEDGDRLHAAGILYAPDYVVNAGGVIQLVGLEDLGWGEGELQEELAKIGDTLRTLFTQRVKDSITPAAAAERLAAERVAAAQAHTVETLIESFQSHCRRRSARRGRLRRSARPARRRSQARPPRRA